MLVGKVIDSDIIVFRFEILMRRELNTILITLFESQIIRNYLSNNAQFLKEISTHNNVVIVTDKKHSPVIHSFLNSVDFDKLTIIEFDYSEYSYIFKFCSSILKWSHKSSSIFREILSRSESSKKAKIVMPIRMLIHLTLKRSLWIDQIFRLIILKTFDLVKFTEYLNTQVVKPGLVEYKSVFITSLTNLKDIHVVLYAKRMNIKTIATVRSWDNLSSHGRLIADVDIFYSHSNFMSELIREFHPHDEFEVHTLVAPNYQQNYILGNQTKPLKNFLKIGYSCMGPKVNPDDYNFINEFNALAKNFSQQTFFIIQHPMYPHDIKFQLNKNVRVIQYGYDQTSLQEYYKDLRTFDLIIGGGTSAILDAAVLEIPVVYIGFEYKTHKYWSSALRYMDYLYHFDKFIEKTNIHICKSQSELAEIIGEKNYDFYKINSESVSYFSGNLNLDLNLRLTELLSQN